MSKERDYLHIPPGEEIRFINGFYVVEEEKKLKGKRGEILVIIGYLIVDNSCCGTGGCRYALIPGYIRKWHYRKENGKVVTRIECLEEEEKKEIEEVLKKNFLQQVIFW